MAKFASVEEYIASLAEPLRAIGEKLVPVVNAALPDATPAIWHGHPVWDLSSTPGKAAVAFCKAYTSYVTFGLFRAANVTDPSGRLKVSTGLMGNVKLKSVGDIDVELFTDWLQQGTKLERAAQNG